MIGEVEPEHLLAGETTVQAAERQANEFRAYLENLIHEHRKPGGGHSDFINRLVNARVQGKPSDAGWAGTVRCSATRIAVPSARASGSAPNI